MASTPKGWASLISLNPATKEGLKNLTSVGVLVNAAWFVTTFFRPEVPTITASTALVSAAVGLLLLLRVLLFAADPLETLRASWPPEPRFFQSHYPSKVLLARCASCQNRTPCGERPLKPESRDYVAAWYEIFDGLAQDDPDLRQRTYEKGFTCRLVFYLKYSVLFFLTLAIPIATWSVLSSLHAAQHRDVLAILRGGQLIYIAVNLLLFTAIALLNRPRALNPTGCWAMWRDINAQHVYRLGRQEPRLVELICNRFQPQTAEVRRRTPAAASKPTRGKRGAPRDGGASEEPGA